MWAHQRMCSSVGMRWISLRPGWSFQEKWVCASTRPGIRVAPAPSTVVTPAVGSARAPRAIREMRLPWMRTSPGYGRAPVPSKIRTFVNSTLVIAASYRGAAPPRVGCCAALGSSGFCETPVSHGWVILENALPSCQPAFLRSQ